MIGLEKSFQLIYSNTHLTTRETLPLKNSRHTDIHRQKSALPVFAELPLPQEPIGELLFQNTATGVWTVSDFLVVMIRF